MCPVSVVLYIHLSACVSIYKYINGAEDAIVATKKTVYEWRWNEGRGGLVGVCGPPVALTTFIGHNLYGRNGVLSNNNNKKKGGMNKIKRRRVPLQCHNKLTKSLAFTVTLFLCVVECRKKFELLARHSNRQSRMNGGEKKVHIVLRRGGPEETGNVLKRFRTLLQFSAVLSNPL